MDKTTRLKLQEQQALKNSAAMCDTIVRECTREGRGDPRRLNELTKWRNSCMRRTGFVPPSVAALNA